MKKIFPFLLAVVLFTSCDVNTDPIELSATSDVNEAISVSILQTSGTSVGFNQSLNQDLTEIFSNFSDVTGITINSLNYEYENVTGNANAVIQSATIDINGTTIANLSNVNISQEAASGTVFSINDPAILAQLENLFLTNSAVDIQFSGTAISDEGPVSFDIALTINLTITF